MTALYIILCILLFVALILSLRAKLYIKLDSEITLRAGLGPVLLTVVPKKKRKKPRLSAFSYKKHQRRLEKERKKAEKKKKNKAEKIAEKAESENARKKSAGEKIGSLFEIVSFVLEEFPRLASYIHTNIRALHVTVGGSDAARVAELYGIISASVAALTELLDNKTRLKTLKKDSVTVSADFLASKTTVVADISMKLSLFSALRVGLHTLMWLVKRKIGDGDAEKQKNKSNKK